MQKNLKRYHQNTVTKTTKESNFYFKIDIMFYKNELHYQKQQTFKNWSYKLKNFVSLCLWTILAAWKIFCCSRNKFYKQKRKDVEIKCG